MRNLQSVRNGIRQMILCSVLFLASAIPAPGDPVSEAYWRNFYIMPIGRWNATTINEFRTSMLSKVGGVEPKNVKLGVCEVTSTFMQYTQGGYYDYIYEPNHPADNPSDDRGWELHKMMRWAIQEDVRVGSHVNGMPWGDSDVQSVDNLHNFLEKANDGVNGPGAYLQRDRSNRMRTGTSTDPTANEIFSGAPQLEMQLTLSRKAATVQDYWVRNLRQAVRLFQFYRDQHPDLVVFVSGSSEISQAIHPNVDYCDYGPWSVSEFREWLGGTGLYVGFPQYASVGDLNSYVQGGSGATPPGFPLASFGNATPPTTVSYDTATKTGRWWSKWQEFRVAQVGNLVQRQVDVSNQVGFSPDRNFGHQVPGPVSGQTSNDRMYATPYTTAFTSESGNGITTYLDDALNATLFSAINGNDRNWGIFEYNPISTITTFADKARSDLALSRLWNAKCHIVSPYLWDGGLTGGLAVYTIKGRPMEAALQDLILAHQGDPLTAFARHEVNPDSRSPIWSMSEADDIEASSGFTGVGFSKGVMTGTVNSANPSLGLEFAESPTRFLQSDEYHAVSFRLSLSTAGSSEQGRFEWVDESDNTYTVTFKPVTGWNIYRLHLSELASWREKRIKAVRLVPTNVSGAAVKLDWVKLDACPSWLFDDPSEIGGTSGFAPGWSVSGGQFTGTDSNSDGFFFLLGDKPAWTDADRTVIDADRFKTVRIAMTTSGPGTGQLFWWKRGTSFFSKPFPVVAGPQTVAVDMSAEPNWSGKVTQFRLDPVNVAGTAVQVRSVSLAPPLLSPLPTVDDMILNTEFPVLTWDAPVEPGVSGIVYDLQIAADFDFTDVRVSEVALTTTTFVHDGTPALPNGQFWWRVRSRASGGVSSEWSVPMPFFLKKWNFDSAADIYGSTDDLLVRPSDVTGVGASGGIWTATAGDTDGNSVVSPSIFFNNGGILGRGINAALYTRLKLRVRLSNGNQPTGIPQVFFFKDGGSPFYQIALPPIPINNTWVNLDVDLKQNAGWSGYIRRIRFDPSFNRGNFKMELDWAEVAPNPALSPPSGVQGWSMY